MHQFFCFAKLQDTCALASRKASTIEPSRSARLHTHGHRSAAPVPTPISPEVDTMWTAAVWRFFHTSLKPAAALPCVWLCSRTRVCRGDWRLAEVTATPRSRQPGRNLRSLAGASSAQMRGSGETNKLECRSRRRLLCAPRGTPLDASAHCPLDSRHDEPPAVARQAPLLPCGGLMARIRRHFL